MNILIVTPILIAITYYIVNVIIACSKIYKELKETDQWPRF